MALPLAYGIVALVSLGMVGFCVAADKKRDVWLLLLFVSVSMCNLGYFMVSVSQTLESALNANRISYLGSVFLPFFLLMMTMRICQLKRTKLLMVSLVAVGIFMLGLTTSPGILPIYYSTVDIQIANGFTKLVREYGPLHKLYYVYLFGYMFAMVGVAIYAISKKRISSKRRTVLLLCAAFCNIVIWLVEQLLPRGFEWLSVSYILSEAFILVIYRSMQRENSMDRGERMPTYTLSVLLASYLVLFANCVRIITENTTQVMYTVSHVVVLTIYLGILVSWGVSMYDRIVRPSLRRYLIAMVCLMVFWLLVRTVRLTIFRYVYPMGMWLWYAYYIPMILIPLVCLFAAKHIGRPESYRLPRPWLMMYIPSFALIALVLTNDLHQWAFAFYNGYEAGWDEYRRGFLYYAATAWVFVCIALMLAEFVKRCRIPKARKVIWLPIAMLAIGVLYSVLYAMNTDLFGFIEISAGLCFIVVGIWESSIKVGLVHSNSRYEELLKRSGLGMAIVDEGLAVHYRSDDALQLTHEQLRSACDAPLMLGSGVRVSVSRIRGGYALRQKDLSDLLKLLEESEALREELQDANTVSMQNYKVQRRIRTLAEKNRLHDELYRQTAHQIDLLNGWLQKLKTAEDAEEKRQLLRRIVVVGAYLKRRNNLSLVHEQDGSIHGTELELSINEMMKNMQLAGIRCAGSVQLDRPMPAQVVMKLFDFYEAVVEHAFDGLHSMMTRFFLRDGWYYACVDAVCDTDLTVLASDTVGVSLSEDGCYTLSLRIREGSV